MHLSIFILLFATVLVLGQRRVMRAEEFNEQARNRDKKKNNFENQSANPSSGIGINDHDNQ